MFGITCILNIAITSFKRTRKPKDLLGENTIVNSKVKNNKPSTENRDVSHVAAGKVQGIVVK